MWSILLLALRYMQTRKLRTTLTILAVVFGVAVLFGTNISIPSVEQAYRRTLAGPAAVDVRVQSSTGEAFPAEAALATVSRVPGVRAVSGILRRKITLPNVGQTPVEIEIIGLDPAAAQAVSSYPVREGRFLQAGDAGKDSGKAVIPASLAALGGIKLGATFPLLTTAGPRLITVVGFLEDRGKGSLQLYVPLVEAQSMFRLPGRINTIEAALQPGVSRDSATQQVLQALGTGYESSETAAFTQAEAGTVIFNLFGVLALFAGSFLIFNTFRTAVVERTRDLSTLRCMGAEGGQVMRFILIECALQGIIGSLLGMAAGVAIAQYIVALIPTLLPEVGSSVPIMVRPEHLLGAFAAGVITALVAGYFPARQAARVSPLAAIRTEEAEASTRARRNLVIGVGCLVVAVALIIAGEATGGIGALLFLVGSVLLIPFLIAPLAAIFAPLFNLFTAQVGEIARGNLLRQPGRTASTASIIVIGVAVLVATSALLTVLDDGLSNILAAQLEDDRSTFMLLPTNATGSALEPKNIATSSQVGVDSSLSERLKQLPQIEALTSARTGRALIGKTVVSMAAIDPASYTRIRQLRMVSGSQSNALQMLAKERALIINQYFATTYQLAVDKSVTLQTPTGPQIYRVAAVVDNLGTSANEPYAFTGYDSFAADFGKTEEAIIWVKLRPEIERSAGQTAVETVLRDYPQFRVFVTESLTKQGIDTARGTLVTFYILIALVMVPCALGIINTLAINVLERQREIGVLRAIGSERSQIQQIVIVEALLLGLIGGIIGVAVGVAMSGSFVNTMLKFVPHGRYLFPVGGVAAGLLMGVLLTLVASVLPARSAARVEIVQSLQYE